MADIVIRLVVFIILPLFLKKQYLKSMRILAISLLFLIKIPFLQAQQVKLYDTAYTVVTIAPAQNFYLDSRFVSTFNGRSRIALPVTLPEGTVRWFYSFAATESKSEPMEWVGLAGQLTRFIDKTGVTAMFIDRLVKPSGTAACDIFVLNTEGVKAFEAKEDDSYAYERTYSRQNMTGGVVEVIPAKNSFAIGLSNPSLKNGINVKIEVSAIVAKSTPIYNPNAMTKSVNKEANWINTAERDKLYDWTMLTFEGKKTPSVESVCACVVKKIVTNFTPEEFKILTEGEQKTTMYRIRWDCMAEQNTLDLDNELVTLQQAKREVDSLEQAGDFKNMLEKAKYINAAGYTTPANKNRLVRSLMLTGQLEEAFAQAEILSRNYPNDLPIQANFAHLLLFRKREKDAEKHYLKYKNNMAYIQNDAFSQATEIQWERLIARDFQFFIKNKIFNSYYENIKKKLKIAD
jgi:hypothetical protein